MTHGLSGAEASEGLEEELKGFHSSFLSCEKEQAKSEREELARLV